MTVVTIEKIAIIVSPADNVAVAKEDVPANTAVALPEGREVTIKGPVTPGHRFATRAIEPGEFVYQYGQPIGTSLGIREGDPVSHANMTNDVPIVRDLPADLATPAPEYVAESERPTFEGFRRPNGRVGTRNWILIVPTSMCASHEAQQIAMVADLTLVDPERHANLSGVVAIPHNKGCGCPDGSDVDVVLRTLAAYADHANVGGVVFIDLGCEKTNTKLFDRYLQDRGGLGFQKPIAWVSIQESGGTQRAVQDGLDKVRAMLDEVASARRSPCSVADLVLGVECGGSDGFSGLSANPSLGHAADLLVRCGGSVILSEVPEFCGAEHVLANRARDAEVGRAVYGLVDWYRDHANRFGADLGMNPSPGNIAGGLLNITIKSLGAIAKGGTTRVEGVTNWGVPIRSRGLNLMQGPGYDQESVPGLVASGATVVVFTTGRGTTIGNAIVPVIKLSSNTRTYERMKSDLDLSAGGVIDGTETIEQVGRRVYERMQRVASGELSLAEVNKHREFQIWGSQPISL